MLKTVLLASAMIISMPALAQDMKTQQQTPQTPVPTEQVTPATDDAVPTQAPTTAQQAQATPAAPATGPAQIAEVVNSEFPSYDKNSDGNLDKTEFASWMIALKTASDPTTKPGDPATQAWVNGAFATADADKSALVSKDELTAYLSKSAAG